MERTLILLKPDAVQRGLIGEITARFEKKGLKIAAVKFMTISQELAARHYEAHKAKPFYQGLVRFMTSGPVVALVLEGIGVVTISRNMMGATFGSKAAPGTIRGDYGVSNSFNLIHGSDSPEAARVEIANFFSPDEIQEYPLDSFSWIYDPEDELGKI
jgi:nucleoside-diphosphate kinase